MHRLFRLPARCDHWVIVVGVTGMTLNVAGAGDWVPEPVLLGEAVPGAVVLGAEEADADADARAGAAAGAAAPVGGEIRFRSVTKFVTLSRVMIRSVPSTKESWLK